jgi:hypothetical protein
MLDGIIRDVDFTGTIAQNAVSRELLNAYERVLGEH